MDEQQSQGTPMKKSSALVAIVMGSESDLSIMQDAQKVLAEFEVSHIIEVVSAHRTPEEMVKFAKNASSKHRVIIAGAGGAAHLPGMIAAMTSLPVIGVPISLKYLDGMDSLLSIVQMPRGVPVATVAIGNGTNAGLLAVRILAQSLEGQKLKLTQKLDKQRETIRQQVLAGSKLKKKKKL